MKTLLNLSTTFFNKFLKKENSNLTKTPVHYRRDLDSLGEYIKS